MNHAQKRALLVLWTENQRLRMQTPGMLRSDGLARKKDTRSLTNSGCIWLKVSAVLAPNAGEEHARGDGRRKVPRTKNLIARSGDQPVEVVLGRDGRGVNEGVDSAGALHRDQGVVDAFVFAVNRRRPVDVEAIHAVFTDGLPHQGGGAVLPGSVETLQVDAGGANVAEVNPQVAPAAVSVMTRGLAVVADEVRLIAAGTIV